jgi:hypothetical protein
MVHLIADQSGPSPNPSHREPSRANLCPFPSPSPLHQAWHVCTRPHATRRAGVTHNRSPATVSPSSPSSAVQKVGTSMEAVAPGWCPPARRGTPPPVAVASPSLSATGAASVTRPATTAGRGPPHRRAAPPARIGAASPFPPAALIVRLRKREGK